MAENALARLIASVTQRGGETLLGRGTQQDATPSGRAYQVYLAEQTALGQTPLPVSEWMATQGGSKLRGLLR